MANSKITDLTALAVQPDSSDVLPIVDISDTSMAASGTTKKVAYSTLLSGAVADAITDGVTAIAPSQNAVYDALALKLDLAGGTLSGAINTLGVLPTVDSASELGSSSKYWSNTYTDRLYLNSTAYWEGTVAGRINTTAKVVITATPTHASGNHIGYEAYLTHNPTADSNGRTFGMYFTARSESTNAYNLTSSLALIGIEGLVSHDGSGTMNGAAAINAYARVNGTGTLTVGYGVRSYSSSAGAGSIGTYYGVHVDSQTAATTNYAIYTNAGKVSFGDTLHMRDKNIELGTTTGTKIGTAGGASGQKLAFFGATPVVQQTGDIVTALENLGLVTSGTVSGGSGITRSVATVTSTVTLGATANTDYVTFIGASGVVTLPTAVGNTNRYTLKNIDTTNKTVSTTSSQTIDGSLTITLTPNTSVDVISDGTNWRII